MNGGLWRNQPAACIGSRRTQADAIIEMLREKRAFGKPLTLPEIMAAGIAQHGARMKEIRERGFVVRNQMNRSSDGRISSRYWLELDPEDGQQCR